MEGWNDCSDDACASRKADFNDANINDANINDANINDANFMPRVRWWLRARARRRGR